MNANPIVDALTRVERLLFATPRIESFVAKRETGDFDQHDAETADALAAELVAHQFPNGSWGDNLALTADALLLLSDLRPIKAEVTDAATKAIAWLHTRQRAPGAFAESCERERHAQGICCHFATGFFSPGPKTVDFSNAALSNGALFHSDDDARLALSAHALRASLLFEPPRTDDLLNIDALLRIADLVFRDRQHFSTTASMMVLAALVNAPRNPGHVTIVHGALSRLAGLQRADGSWPDAEAFHVADALLSAVRSGYGSPLFDRAIARTADMLILSQHADGSWGNSAGPYRLLLAWRTLRYTAGIRAKVYS